MIELTAVVQRRADVRYRVVPPETVVIRQAGPEVLILNEVAGRILDLADGHRSLAAIGDALAGEYEVPADQARQDVLAFAAELLEAELIELIEPEHGG
jgi:hypothetical protein